MNRGPLLAFFALSAVLFVTYALWAPADDDEIRLGPAEIRDILAWQEELVGYPLGEEEARAAVDAFVQDEVLVREAYRQGVDRGDPRVRQFLAGATRRAVERDRGVTVADPTPEELLAYFEANSERYLRRATVTLDAVLFPFGTLEAGEAESFRVRLNSGEGLDALRDRGAQLNTVRGVTRSQLWRAYGRDIAEQVFARESGLWMGPLQSPQGTDFVRIVSREPSRMPAFEEVESAVRQDWELERYEAAVQTELPGLRRRYRVVVEGVGGP